MAEAGFPGQHTTTTTVTSSTSVQTDMRFDPSYIRTIPGVLKIVQMVSHEVATSTGCINNKLNSSEQMLFIRTVCN